jgi:hypothetical protein
VNRNGVPISRLIRILGCFYAAAPRATVDTDDSQLGILRINYNGPTFLNLGPAAAELFNANGVNLYDGYAEIPVDGGSL